MKRLLFFNSERAMSCTANCRTSWCVVQEYPGGFSSKSFIPMVELTSVVLKKIRLSHGINWRAHLEVFHDNTRTKAVMTFFCSAPPPPPLFFCSVKALFYFISFYFFPLVKALISLFPYSWLYDYSILLELSNNQIEMALLGDFLPKQIRHHQSSKLF